MYGKHFQKNILSIKFYECIARIYGILLYVPIFMMQPIYRRRGMELVHRSINPNICDNEIYRRVMACVLV